MTREEQKEGQTNRLKPDTPTKLKIASIALDTPCGLTAASISRGTLQGLTGLDPIRQAFANRLTDSGTPDLIWGVTPNQSPEASHQPSREPKTAF